MSATSTFPFVGRSREREELRVGLKDLLLGRGSVFFVTGEPGIGKTSLADEIDREAAAQGALVIWGRCWETGGAPAYWPWIQVLRSCLRLPKEQDSDLRDAREAMAIIEVLPEVQSSVAGSASPNVGSTLRFAGDEPVIGRFRLFDAVSNFLKHLAREMPLLIVLDDFHVADEVSLLLLRFLAREIRQTRIMVVVTYRDVEARVLRRTADLLGEAAREGRTLVLRGLGEADVREFVSLSAGQRLDENASKALYRATDGNPFFLTEIMQLLIAEGSITEGGLLRNFRIPEGVRVAIRRRLELVSEPARQVLAIACAVGREFDLSLMTHLKAVAPQQLFESLDQAETAELVRRVPGTIGRYRFDHELIVETLYDDLPRPSREHLHNQIAQAYEELYAGKVEAHLAELAHHYFQSLPRGDVRKAVDYSRRAAQRAQDSLAYEESARLYRMAIKALELAPSNEETTRFDTFRRLGEALYGAGLFTQSREAFENAAKIARDLDRPEDLAQATLGLAMPSTDPGSVDRSLVARLHEALNALKGRDSSLTAMMLARLAWELYWSDEHETRISMIEEAVGIARRVNDLPTLLFVLFAKHWTTWEPDNLEDRLVTAREIVRLADQGGNQYWALRARYFLFVDLLEMGATEDADLEIANYCRLEGDLKMPFGIGTLSRATRAVMEGRFVDGEGLVHQAVAIAERLERRARAFRMAFHSYMLALRREQGRLEELESVYRQVASRQFLPVLVRSELALWFSETGRHTEAAVQFERLAADDFKSIPRNMTWLTIMVMLAEVCASIGDRRRAAVLYEHLRPYSRRNAVLDIHACYGPVARCLGMLSATLGRLDEAEGHLEMALRMDQQMGARPSATRTQYHLANTLQRRGLANDRERSIALLTSALDAASALGMRTLAEQARAALADAQRSTVKGSAEEVVVENGAALDAVVPRTEATTATKASPNIFRREGDYWSVVYKDKTIRLHHSKGLLYISHLLANPSQEIHVLKLAALAQVAPVSDSGDVELIEQPSDAGEVLDSQAKNEYRARAKEVLEELEEAREMNDIGRIELLNGELSMINQQLTAATGIGGRDRRAASNVERARVRVKNTITGALARLAVVHPSLARHLASTLKTGVFCSYQPDSAEAAPWVL